MNASINAELNPLIYLANPIVGFAFLLLALIGTINTATANVEVSQQPLIVGEPVPGNLVLTPSVEWPTINSVANLGNYDPSRVYAGYFDPKKCYKYHFDQNDESQRHFYPVKVSLNHLCPGDDWSGNFLNWATTQTIDPFRSALTGGYRVKDTPTETWLEKARYDNNGANSIFPNRRIPASGNNSSMVNNATPFSQNWIRMRIWRLDNKMRFRLLNDGVDHNVTLYDPSNTTLTDRAYELSVRVKVCDASVGLESNCVKYSQGWKPEGLIQQYSDRLRYSIFGYLNDHSMLRDGGVLRARQKFVGPEKLDPELGWVNNSAMEWDKETGVFVRNPDTQDAAATSATLGVSILDSGVINYLNQFGQMTSKDHKSHDPVSELYYAALNYLRDRGNIPEYSTITGNAQQKFELADGFPVISDWDDPYQYWCQSGAILGIGDVNTHRDKNLPGNTVNRDEPGQPSLVASDSAVNVVTATQKVAELEGITISTPFTGRENSAYIAGLAYYANTVDLRPDLRGKQTVSTHWVDVRENQVLEPRHRNQYWLATKYGGFKVPDGFDPFSHTTALPLEWWHTNGEILSTGDRRPDNFFVASEADKMVSSLQQAFAQIVANMRGSGASLATNSTKLEAGTITYQSLYYPGSWEGDLVAYNVDPVSGMTLGEKWRASSQLPAWGSRKIFVHNPQGSGGNLYRPFLYNNLGSAQQAVMSEAQVNYLRGDRSQEQPAGALRTRSGILGSIVNAQPVFVGAPNPLIYRNRSFPGASSYADHAAAKSNRTPVVYVSSNSGMLHGFNAATGVETYAFVPNQVILNGLSGYAAPNFEHRYFLDGELTVADVFHNNAWKTVLVATLGRAGKGLFALDVTDPSNIKFLWEKSAEDIPALGNNLGKPVIAQVASGDWRVLLGNGPNGNQGRSQLVMLSIADGAVTTVDTTVSGVATQGLSAVYTWDSNDDGYVDTVYAGDFSGNVWRVSGLPGSPVVEKLFQALDANGLSQPITSAPLVGRDPATEAVWVFFGTGQYINVTDLADKRQQTWYGLIDTGEPILGRYELVKRDVLLDTPVDGTFTARVISEGSDADIYGKRGWYIDLPVEGERMVLPNQFRGKALIGTSRIPDASDPCAPTGRGFVMAINPFTGGRLDISFFDVNRDGFFTEGDLIMVDGNPLPASGIGVESAPNNPIFISDVMQFNREDGEIESVLTQSEGMLPSRRTSWREILQ